MAIWEITEELPQDELPDGEYIANILNVKDVSAKGKQKALVSIELENEIRYKIWVDKYNNHVVGFMKAVGHNFADKNFDTQSAVGKTIKLRVSRSDYLGKTYVNVGFEPATKVFQSTDLPFTAELPGGKEALAVVDDNAPF